MAQQTSPRLRSTLVVLNLVSVIACVGGGESTAFAATAGPEENSRLRSLGIAQLENERPAEAEATFRKLIAALPGDPLGHANLAVALLRQQKSDAALAATEEALKRAPKRGDVLAVKADVLKWSGKVDEALTTYQAAAAAAPGSVEIQYQLYRHATTLKNPAADQAMAAALAALARLRPDNLVVLLRRGAAAITQGDRTAATQAFLRVKELAWQAQPVAQETLAKVLDALAQGDLEAARVPALRVENVLKITPMFQQGQRELSQEIQGLPLTRFATEPPPKAWGKPLALTFKSTKLDAAPALGRALATGDFDGDDKPDLLWLTAGGAQLARSGAAGKPVTVGKAPTGAASLLVADLDNDGFQDFLALGPQGSAAWRGAAGGTFSPVADGFGLTSTKAPAGVAFDFDIEGDLDLATVGPTLELYRNNLAGPLAAIGKQSLPAGIGAGALAAVASDLDRDGDLDLALAGDQRVTWLDNLRQGQLKDRTASSGLSGGGKALASADLDNDGWPDLAVAGSGLTLHHNRAGRFESWKIRQPVPPGTALSALVAADFDNDGRLDLATGGDSGLWLLLQKEDGGFDRLTVADAPAKLAALAAADLDLDGDLDLVAAGPGGITRLTNEGGHQNKWISLRLKGLTTGNSKNNTFGLGSVVELRAGSAFQFREATGDVTHFGLGSLSEADVLRVVWTNGVPQNRVQPKGNQRVVEEQLLKGSCPFLYAWTGDSFDFVTDLLWGAPLGLPVAAGAYAFSDPRELVAIPAAEPKAGRYELRVTEELWEAAFFDEVRLWVVDSPADVATASSLKVLPGASVPERVLGARNLRPVATAWDGRGREATAAVARRDEIYADGYLESAYQGVAPEWTFTFDLGTAPAVPLRLWLDGWIFPADASLNLAASQRSDLPYLAPRLEVETSEGWQVLMPHMGHPAGKTKTMVVDTPALPAGAHKLRIVTSLWLGWDQIRWTTEPADEAPRVIARLSPSTATLAPRGFSTLVRRSPNGPHGYDYAAVSPASPWLPFPGRYTRYGEVRELLAAVDDFTVILAAGDELALAFDASALPPLAPGDQRSVFLESHGWDKDADRNTWEAAQVEPLPFAGMSGYPYGRGESYPETEAHRRYQQQWQTREVPPR